MEQRQLLALCKLLLGEAARTAEVALLEGGNCSSYQCLVMHAPASSAETHAFNLTKVL